MTDEADRLTRWVNEHGPAVRGYLRALTGRADLAEDLTQEVFLRAWEARRRFEAIGKDRGYLLTLADRLARTRYDRERRRRDWYEIEEPVAPEVDGASSLEREEINRELAAALGTLTEMQRRTLLLRYYGEVPFAEIAKALETPLGTVLSHCRRGLAAMRRILAPKEKANTRRAEKRMET